MRNTLNRALITRLNSHIARFLYKCVGTFATLLLLSPNAQSFDMSESGKSPYWQVVLAAIQTTDLNLIENLLENPPLYDQKPLKNAGGEFGYYLFALLQNEIEPEDVARVEKIIKRSIALGCPFKKLIPYSEDDNNNDDATAEDSKHLNTIDFIFEYTFMFEKSETNDSIAKKRHLKRSMDFLNLLFETKVIATDEQILVRNTNNPDDWQRMSFLQAAIVIESPALRDQFLPIVPSTTLNNSGMNAAMFAAGNADLATLQKMREVYGAHTAAQQFNFKSSQNFQPTVMHYAIASIYNGASAEDVFLLMNFLTQNGADPDQRSQFHNLLQEVDYQKSFYKNNPARVAENLKLKNLLLENMQRLRENYKAFIQSHQPAGSEANPEPSAAAAGTFVDACKNTLLGKKP